MENLPPQAAPKLTSERFAEFAEALDALYIKGNLSGRNHFAAAWPEAALYIFGEELLHYDREGASDRERRQVLEQEAEDRRLALLEVVENIENKSVFEGALQIEYVQGIIMHHGRRLSMSLYSRAIVDRFVPPMPEELAAEEAARVIAATPPPSQPKVSRQREPEAATRMLESREDPMDHIKPISVEMDMSPDPEPEPEDLSDLRPDQVEALQAQKEEFEDEIEDKPLFVAGVLPPAPPVEEPVAEPPVIPEEPKEEDLLPPPSEPQPKPGESSTPVVSKKLSIFKISDAGGGNTES